MKKRPIYAIYLNKSQLEGLKELELELQQYGIEVKEEGALIRALFEYGLETIMQQDDRTKIEEILKRVRIDTMMIDPKNRKLTDIAKLILLKSAEVSTE